VADRDLRSGLPQVELQQLAGAIDSALIGPPALEQRPDVAQVVIEDRLRPVVAELLDQLADALARDPRVVAQQAMDLVLERVELRRPPRALIARRPSRRSARRTVLRSCPVRRTISWIESPSASRIRLISPSAARRAPPSSSPVT
jgi:hypothetical protein